MIERYSACATDASLGPRIPGLFTPVLRYSLGGIPDRFSWEFVPEGEIWSYTTGGEPVVAESDLVKLVAYKHG